MSILADRCINPNCRELIRYEEGTQEIRCPWCDHAFLAREFEGEQKKVVEALMAGKQAKAALSMERKEKEALQALLNKSQQAWIDYADVQKHVKEQLKKIEKNTADIKGDTEELLAGQKDILREVEKNRRVNEAGNQRLLENFERDRKQDAEEREQLRRDLDALKAEVDKESGKRGGPTAVVQEKVIHALPKEPKCATAAARRAEIVVASRADAERREEERRMERVYQEAARRAPQGPNGELYTPESEFELGNIGEDYYIRKYKGRREVVAIPPQIRGRKVVAIGKKAFAGPTILDANRMLVELIVPTTVKYLEPRACWMCINLRSVEAHKYIEEIGANAFVGCRFMNMIYFGMGERSEGVVTFPPALKKIGSQAFLNKDGGLGSFITEANLSRKTKLKSPMGFGPFPKNHCAIFYYD